MTDALVIVLVAVAAVYGVFAGAVGTGPNAPRWLRWPAPIWDRIAHGPRPAPLPPRPDYARIARLEREFGFVDGPAPFREGVKRGPRSETRPMRTVHTVCLTKNCEGFTEEITTWSGVPALRIHHCRRPA